ncbi:hypothetical protein [Streptomyces spectabilis]|nr:hypothetical protein [Streptomyces spectabilis]
MFDDIRDFLDGELWFLARSDHDGPPTLPPEFVRLLEREPGSG